MSTIPIDQKTAIKMQTICQTARKLHRFLITYQETNFNLYRLDVEAHNLENEARQMDLAIMTVLNELEEEISLELLHEQKIEKELDCILKAVPEGSVMTLEDCKVYTKEEFESKFPSAKKIHHDKNKQTVSEE